MDSIERPIAVVGVTNRLEVMGYIDCCFLLCVKQAEAQANLGLVSSGCTDERLRYECLN